MVPKVGSESGDQVDNAVDGFWSAIIGTFEAGAAGDNASEIEPDCAADDAVFPFEDGVSVDNDSSLDLEEDCAAKAMTIDILPTYTLGSSACSVTAISEFPVILALSTITPGLDEILAVPPFTGQTDVP